MYSATSGKLEQCIIDARRRVFRQLIEALLFEGVLSPERIAEGDGELLVMHGADRDGGRVRYICRTRVRFTFGMIRLTDDPVFRIAAGAKREVDDPLLFVQELLTAADSSSSAVLEPFLRELEATVENEAQCGEERSKRHIPLAGSSPAELDMLASDGHPYHPCFRSRLGFGSEDNRRYSPEFAPSFRLMWLAAHREDVLWNAGNETDWDWFLNLELGGVERGRLRRMLAESGARPDRYALLPVHAWQWEHELRTRCADAMQNKRLIPLGLGPDVYQPLQSIRTLTNRSRPAGADIKLSLHIVNTSSLRALSPHSVAAAPAVSRWLQAVIDSDCYLKNEARLIVLHEYAGISYLPAQGAAGAIWRENVKPYLADGEEAVPFHALPAQEPDGSPFIRPWVQAYGLRAWFGALLRSCVIPLVHLLAAHGIALESHAQNMMLVHRNGLPVRVALRDFHEGVKYYRSYLTAPGLLPDFGAIHPAFSAARPGEHLETESLEAPRGTMIDALWFMNIAYLIMYMSDRFGASEQELWGLAAAELLAYREAFPELGERFDALGLFAPEYAIEPVAQKCLYGKLAFTPPLHPNPLYRALQEESGCSL